MSTQPKLEIDGLIAELLALGKSLKPSRRWSRAWSSAKPICVRALT